MSNYCPHCGKLLPPDSMYCDHCGQKIANNFSRPVNVEQKLTKDALINLYFSPKGRLNRKPYFWNSLLITILNAVLVAIMEEADTFFGLLAVLLLIAVLVANIMISIKRLHDLNHSGWLVLLTFIPVINFFIGIYLLFFKGTVGPNKYGLDPLPYSV